MKRTIEEATAHFEGQVLTAEDLQISLQSLNDLLTEGGKRFSREVALLQDLDHEIFTLNEQLTQQKKENTIKDQTSKELFAYYETYSTIIHQVFGIQLEFIVPPTKLMKECSGIIHALFEELPEQLIALYFSISCSLLQVKVRID